VDKDLEPAVVRGGSLMGLFYTIIMLSAIGISFVNPVISFFIYGFIVVAFIIFTALGRAEIAMTMPTAHKSEENNQVGKC